VKVEIGDIIESEYGKGKIVAITNEWIVHKDGSHEVAIPIADCQFWIPAEPGENGTLKHSLEIE
jgi:hypothetical protein